jgi:hypothetical protein
LVDSAFGLQIFDCQAVARSTEGVKGSQDATRIFGGRPYSKIEIFRRSRQAMCRHRVAAHNEKLNALLGECGQHVADSGFSNLLSRERPRIQG